VRTDRFTTALKGFIKRPVFIILMIGLTVRLVLMPLLTHPFDLGAWAVTIQHIQAGAGLYEISGYWYTPVWGYFLALWSNVMDLFGVTSYGSMFSDAIMVEYSEVRTLAIFLTPAFNFFIKVPLLISDLITGYLIYRIVFERTKDKNKATLGFALWFLCPMVILNSAVHGMFDTVMIMFMLLSVYSLYKGHNFLAGISFSVAVLLKIFPVFILPALVAYLMMKHKGDMRTTLRHLGMAALGATVMFVLIYVPQIIDGTLGESFIFFTSRFDVVAGSLSSGPTGLTVDFLQYLAAIILAIILAIRMYRKGEEKGDEAFFSCLMLSTAVAVLIPAAPQYQVIFMPFMVLFAVMFDRRLIWPFLILSVMVSVYALVVYNFYIFSTLAAYFGFLEIDQLLRLAEWTCRPVPGTSIPLHTFSIGTLTIIIAAFKLMIIRHWIKYERGRHATDDQK